MLSADEEGEDISLTTAEVGFYQLSQSVPNNTTNCFWPYQTWTSGGANFVQEAYFPYKIRRVNNGYIVNYGGQDYIAKDMTDVTKLLREFESK